MMESGIYVHENCSRVMEELSGEEVGLVRSEGPEGASAEPGPSVGEVVVRVRDRQDGWCCLDVLGDADGVALVTRFLTGRTSLEKVILWDHNADLGEIRYALYHRGEMVEQLSVEGPALDAVSFVSELRHVPLRDLIRPMDFALDALERFGMSPRSVNLEPSELRTVTFFLPPRRSFWQVLLGTLSSGRR